MDAPEKISVHPDHAAPDWHSGEFKAGEGEGEGEVTYIRADLHAARLAELERERDEAEGARIVNATGLRMQKERADRLAGLLKEAGEALRALVWRARFLDDTGPPGEGWQTPELKSVIEAADTILTRMEG